MLEKIRKAMATICTKTYVEPKIIEEFRKLYTFVPSHYETATALFQLDPEKWTVLEFYDSSSEKTIKFLGHEIKPEKMFNPMENERWMWEKSPHTLWEDLARWEKYQHEVSHQMTISFLNRISDEPLWERIKEQGDRIWDTRIDFSHYHHNAELNNAIKLLKLGYVYLDLPYGDLKLMLKEKAAYDAKIANLKAEDKAIQVAKDESKSALQHQAASAEKSLILLKEMQRKATAQQKLAHSMIQKGASGTLDVASRLLED